MPDGDEIDPRDEDGNVGPLAEERDWLLESIVELAAIGLEVGMTLSIRGLLVSGVVISPKTYLAESASEVRSSILSKPGEMLGDFFERHAHDKLANSPDGYRAPSSYVHMRNPIFIAPNGNTSTVRESLWRWKLSEVDGFSLSQISPRFNGA